MSVGAKEEGKGRRVLLEGVVEKLSDGMLNRWKSRYLRLFIGGVEDGVEKDNLLYFESSEDAKRADGKPKEAISLTPITRIDVGASGMEFANEKERKRVFTVKPSENPAAKVFIFRAETEEAGVAWRTALYSIVARGKTSMSITWEPPLYYAIRSRNMEYFRYLLAKGEDIKALVKSETASLLELTLAQDDPVLADMANELLSHGADVNMLSTVEKRPLLMMAIAQKRANLSQMLLRNNANVNIVDPTSKATPLQLAMELNLEGIFSQLILAGADPNNPGASGMPPLAFAVNSGNLVFVKGLLAAGAKAPAALVIPKALEKKNTLMLVSLLEAGISPNDPCFEDGSSPLHYVIWHFPQEMSLVSALLRFKADPSFKDKQDRTLLYLAWQKHPLGYSAFNALLEAGARINDPTVNGLPLVFHVMGGSEAKSEAKMYPKALLSRGAACNFGARGPHGETLLYQALTAHSDDELLNLVLKHDVDVNQPSVHELPVIYYAVALRRIDAVRSLVKAGAKVDVKDAQGRTLLFLASFPPDLALVDELLRAGCSVVEPTVDDLPLHVYLYTRPEARDPGFIYALVKHRPSQAHIPTEAVPETTRIKETRFELLKRLLGRVPDPIAALSIRDPLNQRTIVEMLVSEGEVQGLHTLLNLYKPPFAPFSVSSTGEPLLTLVAKRKPESRFTQKMVWDLLEELLTLPGISRENVNVSDVDGVPLLTLVMMADCPDSLITSLISLGADDNAALSPVDGKTALFHAVRLSRTNAAQWLIQSGSKVEWTTPSPHLVLMAYEKGNKDITKMLLAAGGDPRGEDAEGNTLLHLAVHRKDVPMFAMFLQHGCPLYLANGKQYTVEDLIKLVPESPFKKEILDEVKSFHSNPEKFATAVAIEPIVANIWTRVLELLAEQGIEATDMKLLAEIERVAKDTISSSKAVKDLHACRTVSILKFNCTELGDKLAPQVSVLIAARTEDAPSISSSIEQGIMMWAQEKPRPSSP